MTASGVVRFLRDATCTLDFSCRVLRESEGRLLYLWLNMITLAQCSQVAGNEEARKHASERIIEQMRRWLQTAGEH